MSDVMSGSLGLHDKLQILVTAAAICRVQADIRAGEDKRGHSSFAALTRHVCKFVVAYRSPQSQAESAFCKRSSACGLQPMIRKAAET